MIPQFAILDYHFPLVKDSIERNYVGRGSAVCNIGSTMLADTRGRIRTAMLAGSDGATTVSILVNGVPQVEASDEGVAVENPTFLTHNRGDVIQASVVSGTTQGTVAFDMEEFELIKRDDLVRTPSRYRLTRESQKTSYDPQSDKPKQLRERWGSFAEATSRIREAKERFVNGDL